MVRKLIDFVALFPQLFQKNGAEYFVDMMPALHNYITVDTPAFLSNQNHVIAMYNMCKSVRVQFAYVYAHS